MTEERVAADGFSPEWLALREPWDIQARARAAPALGLASLGDRLRARAGTPRLRVLDLACGTGANLRALAPILGGAQVWTLLDHDRCLLDALPDHLAAWASAHGWQLARHPGTLQVQGDGFEVEIQTMACDLASDPAGWPLARSHLLTASALLDLVSEAWLVQVADACTRAGVPAFFALSVDGRLQWQPADPDDAAVQALFEAHQGRDKGFGPALGPRAAGVAATVFRAHGAEVVQASSPWEIDGHSAPAQALLHELVRGMAMAAAQQAGSKQAGSRAAADAQRISAWRARRLALAGQTRLEVGHQDVLAWPGVQPLSSID